MIPQILCLLTFLSVTVYAEPRVVPPPATGTARFHDDETARLAVTTSPVRPGPDTCPAVVGQHLDNDTLQRLVGIMISPAHYHMGNSFQAREFLREAASQNSALAERIFNATSDAYDSVLKEFPGSETGDLLQLLSEAAAFLPKTHRFSNPAELASALRGHAMARLTEVIANEQAKLQKPLDDKFENAKKTLSGRFIKTPLRKIAPAVNALLTGKDLPASVANIVAGYSKSLDILGSPSERDLHGLNAQERAAEIARREALKAKEVQEFMGGLEEKGLTQAKAYLAQPLARHFTLQNMNNIIEEWRKAPTSTSTISLLGQLIAESKDERVSGAAKKFLQISDSKYLQDIRKQITARADDEKAGMQKTAVEIRKNNREIAELAVGLGLNIAALADPSPLCSALSSGYCLYQELKKEDPDYLVVALSFVGMLPALGKLAVGAKAAKQMRQLIAATEKAKSLLETIMNTRRALAQAKNATGFLDYGIALAGAAADKQVTQLVGKISMPVREGIEAYTGLPFTVQEQEPFAAAMIREAVEGTKVGKKLQETCSAFDRRIAKLKEVLAAPGKKIREAFRGEPTLQPQPPVVAAADRAVLMSPYDSQFMQMMQQLK